MNPSGGNPRRAILARPYRAQYSDPIAMRAGDVVTVGKRDAEYVGWVWCTHPDGRSGWVHESSLSMEADHGRAQRDYSARELTAEAGEVVELREELGGWVRVTNARGESGWLPADHLRAGEPT